MGTNYYLHSPKCEHCGHTEKPLHIGKSSGGWCFSIHVIPEEYINNLNVWRSLWEMPGRWIENEYGERIPIDEMEEIITQRSWQPDFDSRKWNSMNCYRDEAHFHELNNSERGPNNLLRHKIGPHCAGHGEGTWDYINGEFS